MITLEKIDIFNKYSGDSYGFAKSASEAYKALFEANEWMQIENFFIDIERINKQFVSQSYINQTLQRLKEYCDDLAFVALVDTIEFYADFQRVAELLRKIKSFITPEADTLWAAYDNAEVFLNDLNIDIENIENCNFESLHNVNAEFLVASTYQELSLSNGWSNQYLVIAEDFDKIYEKICKWSGQSNISEPKPTLFQRFSKIFK